MYKAIKQEGRCIVVLIHVQGLWFYMAEYGEQVYIATTYVIITYVYSRRDLQVWPLEIITFTINRISYVGRKRNTYPSLLDEHQVWHLTGNRVTCGSNPGGGGIFPPFFGPLVVSLRSGYLKAAGKPSVLQKFLVHMSSVHLICCTEIIIIIITWGEPHHMGTTVHLSSFIIA